MNGKSKLVNIQKKKKKGIFNDRTCKDYLENFQKSFVLVPADKTSNSILIFCGKDYLKELDTSDGTSPQQTYARCGTPIEILVTECKEFVDRQNLRGNEATPNFYWLPKMHKTQ